MNFGCKWHRDRWIDVFLLWLCGLYILFRDAFDLKYSVGILRAPGGLGRNKVPDDVLDLDSHELFESDEEDIGEDDDGEQVNIVMKHANTNIRFTGLIAAVFSKCSIYFK